MDDPLRTTNPMAQADHSAAHALRQTLGDGLALWLASEGVERLGALLRSPEPPAPAEGAGALTYTVKARAWRLRERLCVVEPAPDALRWLQALLDDEAALSAALATPDPVHPDEYVCVQHMRLSAVPSPHDPKHPTLNENYRTWSCADRAREDMNANPSERLTEAHRFAQRRASALIGRAEPVTCTFSATRGAQDPIGELAHRARVTLSRLDPEQWRRAETFTPAFPYARWIQFGDTVLTTPPQLQPFRHYLVRVAKLEERRLSVAVEGPRHPEHHNAMLEAAIDRAKECTGWEPGDPHVGDYVEHYAALDADPESDRHHVPEPLTMFARI